LIEVDKLALILHRLVSGLFVIVCQVRDLGLGGGGHGVFTEVLHAQLDYLLIFLRFTTAVTAIHIIGRLYLFCHPN